jgi:hypothetical protein
VHFRKGINRFLAREVVMWRSLLFSVFLIQVCLLATACGNRIPPPGGPVDETSPRIVSIEPDSNSINVDLKASVRVEFDEEIIKDRRGDAISISPFHDRLRIKYGWESIELKPEGGLLSDCTYNIRLSGKVSDPRGNILGEPLSYSFSTGDSLFSGTIKGLVELEEEFKGKIIFQAVFLPDSLVYRTDVDNEGFFSLRHMPRGSYRLLVFMDTRLNGIHDPAEEYAEEKEVELTDHVLEVKFPFQVPE